ncbi:MAG: P-loop NTPase [Actinomycetota bacterium]
MNNITKNEKVAKNMARVKNKFLIFSGKGGVGKTTVSVNLSYNLHQKGYRVGLLDVDIHGPNVIKMLGLENRRITGQEDRINPIELVEGFKVMSTASILENKDTPIIWRGPLKMKLIQQFLSDVSWGELDFLIVDAPPGTGDEPLSIAQLLPDLSGGIVVTTPQQVAIIDARKSIQFARQLKISYIGVIENMSGFLCPHCGKEVNLFKTGGGKEVAEDMGVDFLGSIPFDTKIMESSDEGKIYLKNIQDNRKIKEAYNKITGNIVKNSGI